MLVTFRKTVLAVLVAMLAVTIVYLIAVGISIAIQGHPGGGLTFHG